MFLPWQYWTIDSCFCRKSLGTERQCSFRLICGCETIGCETKVHSGWSGHQCFKKFSRGCGEQRGRVVKINTSGYDRKQEHHHWTILSCDVFVTKVEMEQCKTQWVSGGDNDFFVFMWIILLLQKTWHSDFWLRVFLGASKSREGNSRGT